MENLMDEPGFVVEKITGEFVLADEVHLLECELEVYEGDKRNDHIYAFLMMNLLSFRVPRTKYHEMAVQTGVVLLGGIMLLVRHTGIQVLR